MAKEILTAESVTSGHPDKLSDLIADSILDACLEQDPESRVACEVLLTKGQAVIAGEITTQAIVDYIEVARTVIEEVGYSTNGMEFTVHIHTQSRDIAQGVFGVDEQGAGDQGIVYGYADEETLNFMPLSVELAHRLTERLEFCRVEGIIDGLLPDGKSQVSVEYENGRFSRIASITLSCQHRKDKTVDLLRKEVKEQVVDFVFRDIPLDAETELLINPSGIFVLGGFEADTGLTGRKLMVDSYFGTGKFTDEKIKAAVLRVFDLRPHSIIEMLDLKQPVYAQTATGGHFGKEYLMWEQLNQTDALLKAIK